MKRNRRKGRSAAFMRSINPFLKKKKRSHSRGATTMVKHRKAVAKRGFSIGKVTNIFIGAGMAALYEVFVSPMIPVANGNIKNALELVLGVILATMPNMPTMVRAGGIALATINAYAIIAPYIAGFAQGNNGRTEY